MQFPPFCPNKDCPCYHHPPASKWFVRNGSYTNSYSHRIQRFRCSHCGTGFSSQTFSIHYCAKKKIPFKTLFQHLCTASGIRDIGRIMHIDPNTVIRKTTVLSRQAIALHCSLLAHFNLNEDLCADGFESFVQSQYFPNNINLLVGRESQFLLAMDYAHLRRKGRMTEAQKNRNDELQASTSLGRTSVQESFHLLMDSLSQALERRRKQEITLSTDEHRSYLRPIRGLQKRYGRDLKHRRISGKAPRTIRNPLFGVNYLDRQLRKDNANHVRETVQFSRNVSAQMERMAVYRMYHNYVKPYRVKEGIGMSHGEKGGIPGTRIREELSTIFSRRRFLGKVVKGGVIGVSEMKIWLKALTTPGRLEADYVPGYALV